MTTHKTFSGMIRAAERLIADLEASDSLVPGDREYHSLGKRLDAILGELRAAWANPAQELEAVKAANRLRDAWHAVQGLGAQPTFLPGIPSEV